MSYAIVFSSKTGNTKLLADTLHTCLPTGNCCYFGTPDPAAMEADDLYVGFWTDKGNADESTLDFLKQLHGKTSSSLAPPVLAAVRSISARS